MSLCVMQNVLCSEGAEGVTLAGESEDPGQVRRELCFTLHKLGYLTPHIGREGQPPEDERGTLQLLRRALPTDPASLALIFTLRALESDDPRRALEEMEDASRWARRAVLSPL